jgi:hypothetical protein
MTYKIGGVTILQPTSGRWMPRRPLDFTGEGRTLYPQVYQFRLQWGLMAMSDYNDLYEQYLDVSATGTAVVELPELSAPTYQFREFSGTFLQSPTVSEYFQEHVKNVVLTITNIVL